MKIRNGFVSNSSSSSFILIAKGGMPQKNDISTLTEKEFYRVDSTEVNVTGNKEPDGEISYCRGNVMRIDSVADKVKYIIALYALYIIGANDTNAYFFKMHNIKEWIYNKGLEYGYKLDITTPPLYGRVVDENLVWDEDIKKYKRVPIKPWIETYVNIYTECNYSKEIANMVENDKDKLENFLFNPYSFGILGGDEYAETYRLEREAFLQVRKEGYPGHPYERIADYPDHEIGDIIYVAQDGTEHCYDYAYHWGELDCENSDDYDCEECSFRDECINTSKKR